MTKEDHAILEKIKDKSIPCAVVMNKADLLPGQPSGPLPSSVHPSSGKQETDCAFVPSIWVSTTDHTNIEKLKELIAALAPAEDSERRIVGDLIRPSDLIVLVVPIDKAAPKGRLILPQQQTIRDILDAGAVSIVTRNTELKDTLAALGRKPALVITDSQAFEQVSGDVPEDIPLTSFSILFARYKGNLKHLVKGARVLEDLKDGEIGRAHV